MLLEAETITHRFAFACKSAGYSGHFCAYIALPQWCSQTLACVDALQSFHACVLKLVCSRCSVEFQ